MPTVPKTSGRSVEVAPISGVRQRDVSSRRSFVDGTAVGAAALAEGLDQASKGGVTIAQKMQIENNERQAKELDVELAEGLRTLGYGNGRDDPGFYSTRGEVTVNAAPDAKKRMEDLQRDLSARAAGNPQVQKMYAKSSRARIARETANIDRHTLKQTQVANQAASEARMGEAIEDGVAYNDPEILARSAGIIQMEIADQTERLGWSPEVAQAEQEKALTALYRNAIYQATRQGDVATAKQLLDTYGAQMDGTIRAEATAFVEKAAMDIDVIDEVDSYLASDLTEKEAMARASSEDNPDKRKALRREVTGRYAQKRRFEDEERKAIREEAYDAVQGTGDSGPVALSAWARENPDKYRKLDGADVTRLERAELKRMEGDMFAPVTDGKTFTDLAKMPTSELAEVNLAEKMQDLTKSEFARAQTLVKGAQQSIERATNSSAGYRLADQVLNNVAPEWMNVNRAKQTQAQDAMENAMRNELYALVATASEEGKIPTKEELTQQAQQLAIRFTGDTSSPLNPVAYFSDVGEFETIMADFGNLTPEQQAVAVVDLNSVPTAMQKDARDDLKSQGINDPSEDLLASYIGAFIFGDVQRMNEIVARAQQ